MKKIILVCVFLFLLSGCYDYKELNDYAIVTGIAIDKIKDKYEVSVLISNSSKTSSDAESKESDVVVYSGHGDTIFEAFKDIGLSSPKEIYIGSFSILLISEDVAKEGINNVIDVFLRYPNSRKSFYLTIVKNDKAKDVLKIMTPLANFPSQNISNNLASSTSLQGIIRKVSFNELLSILVQDGIEPTINSIPHAVVFFFDGSTDEVVQSEDNQFYKELVYLSKRKGYNNIQIVLSRIDVFENKFYDRNKNINQSEINMKLNKYKDIQIERVIQSLGVSRSNIHFLENYHVEGQMNNSVEIDYHILKTMMDILNSAELFIMSYMTQRETCFCFGGKYM